MDIFLGGGGGGVIKKSDFFGGEVISIHFKTFQGQDTEWEYFLGPQNFKLFGYT